MQVFSWEGLRYVTCTPPKTGSAWLREALLYGCKATYTGAQHRPLREAPQADAVLVTTRRPTEWYPSLFRHALRRPQPQRAPLAAYIAAGGRPDLANLAQAGGPVHLHEDVTRVMFRAFLRAALQMYSPPAHPGVVITTRGFEPQPREGLASQLFRHLYKTSTDMPRRAVRTTALLEGVQAALPGIDVLPRLSGRRVNDSENHAGKARLPVGFNPCYAGWYDDTLVDQVLEADRWHYKTFQWTPKPTSPPAKWALLEL